MLWSAKVLGVVRRRVRMQFAATFAVYWANLAKENIGSLETLPCDHLDNQSLHPKISTQAVQTQSCDLCHW